MSKIEGLPVTTPIQTNFGSIERVGLSELRIYTRPDQERHQDQDCHCNENVRPRPMPLPQDQVLEQRTSGQESIVDDSNAMAGLSLHRHRICNRCM